MNKNNGKVCIVTGATSGIGFETSKKFLMEGYSVAALSIDSEERVINAIGKLKKLGDVVFYRCNIAEGKECKAIVEKVIEHYGHIDVLVNNAGIVGKTLNFSDDATLDDVMNVVKVNLLGTVSMSYYVSKYMLEKKMGVIVNVGSLSGEIVNGVSIGYASSKAAVHMATKVMARDLAPHGIRVVTVAPGCINTELLLPEYKEYCGSLELKKRVIEPEELAGAIYIMTLPEAAAINGSTVMADDGYCSFKM